MPNIEIHGVKKEDSYKLRLSIFELFLEEEYVKEMVVTRCLTEVSDVTGRIQPFLRLCNSCNEHTEEIIEKLKTLGMDIEHMELKKFIPKKDTKTNDVDSLFWPWLR